MNERGRLIYKAMKSPVLYQDAWLSSWSTVRLRRSIRNATVDDDRHRHGRLLWAGVFFFFYLHHSSTLQEGTRKKGLVCRCHCSQHLLNETPTNRPRKKNGGRKSTSSSSFFFLSGSFFFFLDTLISHIQHTALRRKDSSSSEKENWIRKFRGGGDACQDSFALHADHANEKKLISTREPWFIYSA